MITHYIKDTNEQYSIREDGIVVSHKRKLDKKLSTTVRNDHVYKSEIVCLYINGKQINIRVETLMFNYFNINTCRNCKNTFINVKRKYLCPCCEKSHNEINMKKWLDNNPDKKKKYTKEGNQRSRKKLTNSYVRSVLKLNKQAAPLELIELERANIKLKRLLASKLNIHINSFQKQ